MDRILLPGAFGLIIVLMVAVSTIGINRMADISKKMDTVVNEHFVKSKHLMDMYWAARDRTVTLLQMLTEKDAFEREELFDDFNKLATRFAAARIAFMEKENDKREIELLGEQARHTSVTVPVQLQVTELLIEDRVEEATQLLVNEGLPLQNNVLKNLGDLVNHLQDSAQQSFLSTRRIYETTTRNIIALAIAAVVISLLIASYVIWRTQQSQNQLRLVNETLEERVQERTRNLEDAYTDLKNFQAQLVHAEKMASLG